ncbi:MULTISPECIES: hypothetical protein [Chryseobacterium]|uniref:hypothetical protein n=1 Tax=Chryseobacterium TaxID=59732 RepID=UPI001623E46D|nr:MULTISPECIES: hypothetical protein [Chryseobacterium]MBF6643909.1 hypothetical protein [Chryseobacterium indologenes]MBU3050408.1 hypothetical protein [Chryseobacterium indologenes]QQQ72363.1 hypothetical protein JHW31_06465 [Chryseobacterium indologenes]
MKNSINSLWGEELNELGYSKITASHFEKKYKNYIFCIDDELADHVLFRILIINSLNQTKCLFDRAIPNRSSISSFEIHNIVREIEKEFAQVITTS